MDADTENPRNLLRDAITASGNRLIRSSVCDDATAKRIYMICDYCADVITDHACPTKILVPLLAEIIAIMAVDKPINIKIPGRRVRVNASIDLWCCVINMPDRH